MKVVKLLGYQQWQGDVMMRTSDLVLQVNEEEKEVKFYQKDTEPIPKEGDEFGDDWELKGKNDKKGNPIIILQKKKNENQKNYQKGFQKKEVSPRSYMINTVLPSVFPAVMGKAYTVKEVTDKMEEFIQWAEKK
jgi:hypothetical protein